MNRLILLALVSLTTIASAHADGTDIAQRILGGAPTLFEMGDGLCDKVFTYYSLENEIVEKNSPTYQGSPSAVCSAAAASPRVYDCSSGSVLNSCSWRNNGAYGNSTYVETHVIKLHHDSVTIEMSMQNTHCDSQYSQNGNCPDQSGEQVFDKFVMFAN